MNLPRVARTASGATFARLLPVLTLLLAISACGRRTTPESARSEPTLVINRTEIVLVESRRLESGVTFSGELKPGESVDVKAKFDGDLLAVRVREGERVRKGQSLGTYRRGEVEDQAKAAEAGLLSARAALLAAENGARRTRKLLEAGAAAPSDLEAAEAQLKAAQAQVESAAAQRNRAAEYAEDLAVPSPIDGWVSSVLVSGGARMAIGDPLLTVVDTRVLELSATVPSEALASVAIGTEISFSIDAFPGERFVGQVARINPTTEPGTRQIRIYTRIENHDGRLVGGLFATGRVVAASADHAVAAPVGVLRQEGTETVVYRLQGGRAERLPIAPGLRDEGNGWVELKGEIAPGDSLLVGILPGVRDGVRVRRNGD
ncbi:MAG: efflux RND transporter periplasmic adaptor subunit [Candidatus Eisenbacteria bacterium]|nr:efflux RND transporter periplasmic adaptor subunit [Candidatus Eisenbacteria bacterium]